MNKVHTRSAWTRWWWWSWWFSHSVMFNSCDPMGCSPPGSAVHGISQARIVEWVAVSFSRGSSRPRNRTWVSWVHSLPTELREKSHAPGQTVKWWSTELQCQPGNKSCPYLPGPCAHLLRPSPRGPAHPLQDAWLQGHHVWIAPTLCWVVVQSSEYSPWVKFMLRDQTTCVSSRSTIYTPFHEVLGFSPAKHKV